MAGIIKAGQSTVPAGFAQPEPYHLGDIAAQAAGALAAARKQAQDIVAAAKREAATIQSRAEQQGMEAALAKAEQKKKQELEAQLKTVLPALKSAAEQLTAARQSWVAAWEAQGVRLAGKIAAKLIRRELAHDPEIPLTLVREALELAAGHKRVRIQLNPRDLALIGDQTRLLAEQWNRLCATEIEASEDVPPGSCRLRTEHGEIDQRFDTQLARIEEELLGSSADISTASS